MASPVQAMDIGYPQLEEHDRRYDYPMALQKLAFEKAEVEHNLVPKRVLPSNRRMVVQMHKKGAWTVAFMSTRPDHEERLRTIRFRDARDRTHAAARTCIEINNSFLTPEIATIQDEYSEGFSFAGGPAAEKVCRLLSDNPPS